MFLRRRPPFLLINLVVCVLLIDTVLFAITQTLTRGLPILVTLFVGWIFGQLSFVAMFAGLWGRTWIIGWLGGVSLVVVGFALCFVAMYSRHMMPDNEWSIIGILPWIGLSVVAPLVAARSFWGWSLTRSDVTEIPRSEHRVEDIFLFSLVAACALVVAQMSIPAPAPAGIELAIAAFGFGYSLLFVLPTVAITYRAKNWGSRIVGYVILSALTILGTAIFFWFVDQSELNNLDDVFYTVVSIAATWLVGIVVLEKSGYRLMRYASTAPVEESLTLPSNPLEVADEDTTVVSTAQTSSRKQMRWLTAGVGIATMLFVVGHFVRDQMLLAQYRNWQDPKAYFNAQVASIDLSNAGIDAVVMLPSATADDLRQVARKARHITSLSLVGTKVDDEMLDAIRLFPKLSELDLSGSSITDDTLSKLPHVTNLSVADTQVSFAAVMHHARMQRIHTVDVGGLGITDEVIASTDEYPTWLQKLELARNPITDTGLSELLTKIGPISMLDVSDTPVDGSGLDNTNFPYTVNLDGTKVTDASLGKLVKSANWKCSRISLRRTQVTSASLQTLAVNVPNFSVRIGQGAITEADLQNMKACRFQSLGLCGPEFTGESIVNRNLTCYALDLTESSVTDAILKEFHQVNWFYSLRLSQTKATFAGLQNLNVNELDLRHSQVKGADLKKLPSQYRTILRHEDCTPQEVLRLRKRGTPVDSDNYQFLW